MSEDQMKTEIADAIAKHLPAAMSTALQKRLAEGDEAIIKVGELKETIAAKNRENQNYLHRIDVLEINVKRAGDLDKREDELNKQELEMLRKTAQNSAAVSGARAETALEIVRLLARNVDYRENVYKSSNVPVMQPGGYASSHSQTDTTNVERKVE